MLHSGDVIVIAVAALRVALDHHAPPTFSVASQGHITRDPGLLALHKAPRVNSRGRRLLDIANQLIALAPREICAVLLGELPNAPSTPRMLTLAGRKGEGKSTGGVKRANVVYPSTPHDHPPVEYVDLIDDDGADDDYSSMMMIDQLSLPELPNEIIDVIFQHLPVMALLRKNCISRAWEERMLRKVTELEGGLFSTLSTALLGKLRSVSKITLNHPSPNDSAALLGLLPGTNASPPPLPKLTQIFLTVEYMEEADAIIHQLTSLATLERISIQPANLEYISWAIDSPGNAALRDLGHTLTKLTELSVPTVLQPKFSRPDIVTKLACLVDNTVPAAYLASMSHLAHLTLIVADETSWLDISPLLHALPPSLTDLLIYGEPVNVLYDTISTRLPRLTHLEFTAWHSTASIATLAEMTHLQNLSIRSAVEFTPLRPLASLVNLRRLAVLAQTDERTDISTNLAALVPQLLTLQELEVTSSTPGKSFGRLAVLESRARKVSLTRLNLWVTAVIRGLPYLTALRLTKCKFVTTGNNIVLPGTLTTLEVKSCRFSKNGGALILPATLETLTLFELATYTYMGDVDTVTRMLPTFEIAKLHALRFLHYTLSPRSHRSDGRTTHRVLEFYAGGDLRNLAHISTVLLGDDAIPLRL